MLIPIKSLSLFLSRAEGCQIADEYQGDWFGLRYGQNVETQVTGQKWGDLTCVEKMEHATLDSSFQGVNSKMVMISEMYVVFFVMIYLLVLVVYI